MLTKNYTIPKNTII